MSRKQKEKYTFLKIALVLLCTAVFIRLASQAGLDEKLVSYGEKVLDNKGLQKLALSSELPSFPDKISNGKTASLTDSKKIEDKLTEEEVMNIEDEAETSEEKEQLQIWEYVPGGKLQKGTYPIENITISPSSPKGYVVYDKIFVKNESSKGIDLKWLLGAKLPFQLTGKGPHVLIIHTHGSESYLPQGKDVYTLSDVERTEDKRYNMIRVGDELEKVLKENGISAVHDRNIYDSPSYNGSYTRALDSIGKYLKENPSIKVVIDVHRDAMTADDGTKYRTVAEVDGKRVAQMMLVMSTGESGLSHPNWAENLKLAVKLQNTMSKKYPGIMRPMNLRKERFNMHATKGSMLVEVGTSANSLSEAIESVKLLGKELAPILKTAK